jgi:hypothetical protein
MATNDRVTADARRRKPLRSAAAFFSGFVVVVVLSLGTDQLLRILKIFPALDQRMDDSLLLLAFGYRTIYSVIGAYVVARFAPYAPMGHALISGALGFVLSLAGAIAMWRLGSHWYPIALVLTALPTAWLGGALHCRSQPGCTADPAETQANPDVYNGA